MKNVKNHQTHIDANYEAFREMLPDLMKKHSGKYVVLRNQEAVEFFDTLHDAVVYAARSYPDKLFSVQEITDQVIDLGWFSHAPAHIEFRT